MASTASLKKFARDLARVLAEDARRSIAPRIKNDVLREALRVESLKNTASLFIPHYWAVYVHDDRGPFGPRRAQLLVWFADPDDDPRLRGGYPVRYRDVRRLTKEQFQFGLRENARRLNAGQGPYMIVKRYEPSTRRGEFFFTIGAKDFERGVDVKVLSEFDALIDRELKAIKRPKPARAKIR